MVNLDSVRKRFLRAVQNFPRWMSVRKRPDKSVTGHFLLSIIEEQEYIAEELRQFISEFFLISYTDRESEIADYVYIAQVGDLTDISSVSLISPDLEIVQNPKYFLKNIDTCCLYQEGYFLISVNNVPSNEALIYDIAGYKYSSKLKRYHIWNIFDEFAMFLGLERYVDDNETNAQLLRRCFLVFARPTNSTITGLKNVVRNCMDNDIKISESEISIKIPDEENIWSPDENYGTIYEKLAQLNKDVLRTKIWGSSQWQHNFKTLQYFSHQWDKELEVYQDGVGQKNDLYVRLSGDEPETTRVEIQPYIYDVITINEHCRKQRLQKRIPLTLKKYKDVLKGHDIQYKISAYPVEEINPSSIYLKEEIKSTGIQKYYLQDLIKDSTYRDDTSIRTIPAEAILEKDKQYKLVFTSSDTYGDFQIERVLLHKSDRTVVDLLKHEHLSVKDKAAKEKSMSAFKFDGDILQYTGVRTHVQRVSNAKNYENLKDVIKNGNIAMELVSPLREAWLTIDVTGMGGEPLRIDTASGMYDITQYASVWTLDGLLLEDHKLVSKTNTSDNGTAILTTYGIGFSFTLEGSDTNQGTASASVYINDVYDPTLSKDVLLPDTEVSARLENRSKIQIVFTKSGNYPFKIKDIKTANFEIECSLTTGELERQVGYYVLPKISDTINNTLTIKIKNYDQVSPTIKSIHIGSATTRRSYTIDKISPTTDGCFLDIRTCCKVSLYEISEEIINSRKRVTQTLIADNLDTAWSFTNNEALTIQIPIDISNFSEVTSSDINIEKTVYNGDIVAYITLLPEQTISEITITGVIKKDIARRSIMSLLNIDTTKEKVYVSRGAGGFLVQNKASGATKILTIDRKNLTKADAFTYEGLSDTIIGVFYHDRPKEDIEYNNNTDRNFEDTFITIKNEDKSIAYNEITTYTSVYGDKEELSIVNTWYPNLENNRLYFYKISDIVADISSAVVFKKENGAYVLTPVQRKALEAFRDSLSSRGFKELNELDRTQVATDISKLKSDYDITVNLNDDEITVQPLYNRVISLLRDGVWSLGISKLFATTDFEFQNSDSYEVEVNGADRIFSLSNNIELPETIDIDEETHYLSEFVIEVPDYLQLKYSEEYGMYKEPYDSTTTNEYSTTDIYIKEDGFNKLAYANIIQNENFIVRIKKNNRWIILPKENIDGTTNYEISEKEGIIIWKNIDNLKGTSLRVEYDYKIPVSLEFRHLQDLYEIINFNLDAYLPIGNPKQLIRGDSEEFSDEDNISVTFTDNEGKSFTPDFVRLNCSNNNFVASYSNGIVYITKAYTDNVALVNAGYYYDGPREFYYFNNMYTKKVEWYKGVSFHNVKKLDMIFLMTMATSNYLLHTDFAPGHLWWELCHVGFADPLVQSSGISTLNVTTACESLNEWHTNNMVVSFVNGINGLATQFSEEDRTGYAVLNITKHIKPGYLFSLFATNGLEISIYREIKVPYRIEEDGEWINFQDELPKTFFCEPFAEFTQSDNYLGYQVPKDISQEYQYYLVIRGNGVVDDIVSKQDIDISKQSTLHLKVVDNFAMDIAENNTIGTVQYLDFDREHCEVDNLEISKDNTIGVASTVDYGLTKIYDSNIDYENVTVTRTVTRKKETFVTGSESGTITTPKILVDNFANTIQCIVKVNDLVVGPMKNFNVKLLGSMGADKYSVQISQKSKTNMAIFVPEQSYPYVQVAVDMDPNKQISSIEVFMRYAENEQTNLSIMDYTHGVLLTKVYDLVTPNNYRLKEILYDTILEEDEEQIIMEEEAPDEIRELVTNDGIDGPEETIDISEYYSFQIRGCKKDDRSLVWTEWYNTDSKHIFNNYQFFQYRVFINSPKIKIKISQFVMEVV